jgi:hypothetical protein
MSVLLDKPLKRELAIGEDRYTLTISPEGLKLVPKGRRIGTELQWQDLVSGQAALAVALNASLERVVVRERRPGPGAQAAEASAQASVAPRRGAGSGSARAESGRPGRGRRRGS